MFTLPSLSNSPTVNCLSCARYTSCNDKHKSILFSCKDYKVSARSTSDTFLRLYDSKQTTVDDNKLSTDIILPGEDSFNIEKVIKKVLKSNTPISPDLKVNDSDFIPAPNFFRFCTGKDYLGEKPFLEQALIGTMIFAEWCPNCSDRKWMERHNVTDSLSTFRDRVQLLRYGKCPKCKARKSDLVRDNI